VGCSHAQARRQVKAAIEKQKQEYADKLEDLTESCQKQVDKLERQLKQRDDEIIVSEHTYGN